MMAVNRYRCFSLAFAAQPGNARINVIDGKAPAFLRSKHQLIFRLQLTQIVEFRSHFRSAREHRIRSGSIIQRRFHPQDSSPPDLQNVFGIGLWTKPTGSPATVGQQFHS